MTRLGGFVRAQSPHQHVDRRIRRHRPIGAVLDKVLDVDEEAPNVNFIPSGAPSGLRLGAALRAPMPKASTAYPPNNPFPASIAAAAADPVSAISLVPRKACWIATKIRRTPPVVRSF